MKLCRYDAGRTGIVLGDAIHDVSEIVRSGTAAAQASGMHPLPHILGVLAGLDDIATRPRVALESVRLDAPAWNPGKIVGAPVNYEAHVREMREQGVAPGHHIADIAEAGLFLKATSSIAGPAQGIALRFPERRTDHEIELVAVIGKAASSVAPEDALDHVAGYCLGLDITLRGAEDRSFRKSIDSYSILGPWLTTADEIADPQSLRLTLWNGTQLRQDASTAEMIFNVAKLIAYASSFYTLEPGDLFFTGTPRGVGPIAKGDLLRAQCPELGSMLVPVR